MKVAILGSRSITSGSFVSTILDKICFDYRINITELVSGHSKKGVDNLAETWALLKGIPIKVFPAYWDVYGISAEIIRNKTLIDYSEFLIAIWDGESRETQYAFEYAISIKKPLVIYNTKEKNYVDVDNRQP